MTPSVAKLWATAMEKAGQDTYVKESDDSGETKEEKEDSSALVLQNKMT